MRLASASELKAAKEAFDSVQYDRAAEQCRTMIGSLVNWPEEISAVASFRSLLIDCLIELQPPDADDTPILTEFDLLFRDYLTAKDRASAAETLIRKSHFLLERDYSQSLANAFKVVELFGRSEDPALLNKALQAFEFLYDEISGEDPGFVQLCLNYANFLHKTAFDCADACARVLNIDDALDARDNVKAVEIIESFLNARAGELAEADRERLQSRLASGYLHLGRDEDAIRLCTLLLLRCDSVSRLDYTILERYCDRRHSRQAATTS
jgi:hypothetical protein